MTFKENTWYRITTPAQTYGDVMFNSVTTELKYVDKEKHLDRMTSYQRELACSDLYTAWEDCLGCIAVMKIKEDYIIEEK